jgi:glycosyltransferase involved in cell wall biosynthesis
MGGNRIGGNMIMKDLTLLICNYNTPELILNLLKSVKSKCENVPNHVVMDSSTIQSDILQRNGIIHYKCNGFTHGEAVNLGFEKITTRYALLMDSDVLILKDFEIAFEKFKEKQLTLMGKIVGNCAGKKLYPRVEPWFCFMDIETLKNKKIKFFDIERTRKSKSEERVYDVGSTMFEDVLKYNLSIGDVSLENKYFRHYGGMSWLVQKYNPNDVDTDIDFGGTHPHKSMYDHGNMVWEFYKKDTQNT